MSWWYVCIFLVIPCSEKSSDRVLQQRFSSSFFIKVTIYFTKPPKPLDQSEMSANINIPNPRSGVALINPSTPAENGGLDNEDFDLIVYENMQIIDPAEQVYTIKGNLGAGQFGKVYAVTISTPEGEEFEFAMKISKSTQDSRDQFEYEAQALSYVCTLFSYFPNFILHFVKLQEKKKRSKNNPHPEKSFIDILSLLT